MKKINIGLLLSLTVLLGLLSSCREQSKDAKVVFNEIQLDNQGGYQDAYGQCSAWVELFNKSYGYVDIAGYQIRAKQGGKESFYTIPQGDVSTKMPPRQFLLFFADGQSARGTYHMSFNLESGQDVLLELYDNANKFVDAVTVEAAKLGVNQSWGVVDESQIQQAWEVKDNSQGRETTPGTNNRAISTSDKMNKFSQKDPVGVGMAISAMAVVFACLALLFFAFRTTGAISMKMEARKAGQKVQPKAAEAAVSSKTEEAEDEVYAAIAMALHEMQGDVHDVEDMVLTMSQTSSSWSSKVLSMRRLPRRK